MSVFRNTLVKLGVVAHAYNPITQEAEVRESRVRGQPELHTKILLQQTKIEGERYSSVAQSLHILHEALGSSPSTTRNRK